MLLIYEFIKVMLIYIVISNSRWSAISRTTMCIYKTILVIITNIISPI